MTKLGWILLVAAVAAVAAGLATCRPSHTVPPGATRSFSLLSGQSWTWCDTTPHGRILWRADGAGQSLHLSTDTDCAGSDSAPAAGTSVGYHEDGRLRISSPAAPSPGVGRPCPVRPSATEMAAFRNILAAQAQTPDHERRRLVSEALAELSRLDPARLVTDVGGGCVPRRWLR